MGVSPEAGSWLEMTAEENAIDYLEKSAEFIQREDSYKWKWVSISLHSALYAFAICALRGTDPDRVAIVRKKRGLLGFCEAMKGGRRADRKRRLIGFPEAIKRCQRDECMLLYADSKALVLSKDEREAVKKIGHTFRNNFIHYSPKLWFIETSGMPLIVRHCCRVVRFLALESGNIQLYGSEQKNRIRDALAVLYIAGAKASH